MYFLTGPVHHFYSYRIRVKRKKKVKKIVSLYSFPFSYFIHSSKFCTVLDDPPLHENTLAGISTTTWLPSAKLLNSFNLGDTPGAV